MCRAGRGGAGGLHRAAAVLVLAVLQCHGQLGSQDACWAWQRASSSSNSNSFCVAATGVLCVLLSGRLAGCVQSP